MRCTSQILVEPVGGFSAKWVALVLALLSLAIVFAACGRKPCDCQPPPGTCSGDDALCSDASGRGDGGTWPSSDLWEPDGSRLDGRLGPPDAAGKSGFEDAGLEGETHDGLVSPDAVGPDLVACPLGTPCNPIPIPALPFQDKQDGKLGPSDQFDEYLPCGEGIDESGPEFFYVLTLDKAGVLHVKVDEKEGDDVDMDVHILSALDPTACLARDHEHAAVYVEAGTYYLSIDTWVDDAGTELAGPYVLDVWVTFGSVLPEQAGFNQYVVEAINDWSIYPKDGTYTYCYSDSCEPPVDIYFGMVHDGYYMGQYIFEGTGKCYCCGHTLEIFLQAYIRWQKAHGMPETTPYGGLTVDDVDLGNFYQYWFGWGVTNEASCGDAFEYAGIGMNIYPEDWDKVVTGDFINFSRSNGTGHAVIFVDWVKEGGELVGLRYYSCNGSGHSHPDPADPDNQTGVSGPSFQTEYFEGSGGKVLKKYFFIGRAFDPVEL